MSDSVDEKNDFCVEEMMKKEKKDSVVGFREAIQKQAITLPETKDKLLKKLVEDFAKDDGVQLQKWVPLDVVLAEFDKAEQQWQKARLEELKKQVICDFFRQFNSINECCQTCPAAGDCAGQKLEEQKKQLQTLFDEMPIYKYDDSYNLELTAWLKKVKDSGLVELNK